MESTLHSQTKCDADTCTQKEGQIFQYEFAFISQCKGHKHMFLIINVTSNTSFTDIL